MQKKRRYAILNNPETSQLESISSIKSEVEQAILKNTLEPFTLNITLSVNRDDVEYDMLILQYCMPIIQMANEYAKAVKFDYPDPEKFAELNIQLPETTSKNKNYYPSLSHYLAIQQLRKTPIKINNREPFNSQTRYGKISPMMYAESETKQEENSAYSYRKLLNSYHRTGNNKTEELLNDVYKFLYMYYTTKEAHSNDEQEQRQNYTNTIFNESDKNHPWYKIYNSLYINDKYKTDITSYINNDKKSKNPTLSVANIFFVDKKDNIDDIYTKLYLGNLSWITDNLIGSAKAKTTIINRLKIAKKFFDFISDNYTEITVLAKYLWTLVVRFRIESENLTAEKIEGELFCENDYFEKALNDALVYSEGLYQLIENSCLHSSGKYVYYSIYVHQTDLEANGDDLIKSAQNIKRLRSEYNKITDFNQCKYYIQFSLVDNAFKFEITDKGSQTIQGGVTNMVEHFNIHNNSNETITSLDKLFDRKSKNLKDVYMHYGLKVLKRNVLVNHGYFIAHTYNIKSYYDMRNKEGDKENLTPQEFPYSGSAYDIIIPVYYQWKNNKIENHVYSNLYANPTDIDIDYIPFLCELEIDAKYNNLEEKVKCIEKIKDNILDNLKEEIGDLKANTAEIDRRIICINTKDLTFSKIELLAKAVFLFISNDKDIENKNLSRRFRIVIFFENKYMINEFARFYSAFYDKSGISEFSKSDSQIALCRFDPESGKNSMPEINIILGHNMITTASSNTRSRIYLNPNSSSEFLPMADYISLTTNSEANSEANAAFHPFFFDLYLDMDKHSFEITPNEYNQSTHSIDNSWFFRNIKQTLITDF